MIYYSQLYYSKLYMSMVAKPMIDDDKLGILATD